MGSAFAFLAATDAGGASRGAMYTGLYVFVWLLTAGLAVPYTVRVCHRWRIRPAFNVLQTVNALVELVAGILRLAGAPEMPTLLAIFRCQTTCRRVFTRNTPMTTGSPTSTGPSGGIRRAGGGELCGFTCPPPLESGRPPLACVSGAGDCVNPVGSVVEYATAARASGSRGHSLLEDFDGLCVLNHDLDVELVERRKDRRPRCQDRSVIRLDQPVAAVSVCAFNPTVNRLAFGRFKVLKDLQDPQVTVLSYSVSPGPSEVEQHVVDLPIVGRRKCGPSKIHSCAPHPTVSVTKITDRRVSHPFVMIDEVTDEPTPRNSSSSPDRSRCRVSWVTVTASPSSPRSAGWPTSTRPRVGTVGRATAENQVTAWTQWVEGTTALSRPGARVPAGQP